MPLGKLVVDSPSFVGRAPVPPEAKKTVTNRLRPRPLVVVSQTISGSLADQPVGHHFEERPITRVRQEVPDNVTRRNSRGKARIQDGPLRCGDRHRREAAGVVRDIGGTLRI